MAEKIFPYISPQPGIYKPYIEVRLGSSKTHKLTPKVLAVIDSGADVCMVSDAITAYLGVVQPKNKQKKILTLTGIDGQGVDCFAVNLVLHVCGRDYECSFYVSDKLPPQAPIILGQRGFFDKHLIVFDAQDSEIRITPF